MKFEILRANCKYEHPGYDIDHQLVSTCRHKDNMPSGSSWGECSKTTCPLITEYLKEPMCYGDAIRQLNNEELARLLANLMDVAGMKIVEMTGIPDLVIFDTPQRRERNIENMVEYLNKPADSHFLFG